MVWIKVVSLQIVGGGDLTQMLWTAAAKVKNWRLLDYDAFCFDVFECRKGNDVEISREVELEAIKNMIMEADQRVTHRPGGCQDFVNDHMHGVASSVNTTLQVSNYIRGSC